MYMTKEIKHDLDHEVYIDPKDGKEHTNHGMHEYTKDDLENVHADYDAVSYTHLTLPTNREV